MGRFPPSRGGIRRGGSRGSPVQLGSSFVQLVDSGKCLFRGVRRRNRLFRGFLFCARISVIMSSFALTAAATAVARVEGRDTHF